MNKLIESLQQIVGPNASVTEPDLLQPHLTEWRDRVRGKTPILLLPDSTAKVAAIVRACAAAGTSIVPQGGNTGMCAGAVPDGSGTQVIVNLARMNQIRSVDPTDFSLVAEAGCILADVQTAASAVGCYFPLSLGGEGSCQIGGNLATNAGGINVLRYGTARDLALGLEVVLADGRVWDGLKTLRKDTAGYDLKQLFIGSEGTLGIITTVAVKLFPPPGALTTALVAVPTASDAVALLAELRALLPERIEAYELIAKRAIEFVLRHIPGTRLPFDEAYPWYVLMDIASGGDSQHLEVALAKAHTDGQIIDAVIAKNATEAEQLWRMRHSISEAEKREGRGIKHDISVPVGRMAEFLQEAETRLAQLCPQAIPVIFGHVGDGNLHYNALLSNAVPEADLGRLAEDVTRVIYELVTTMRGSISAEHGIGVLKKSALETYSSPVALDMMRALKVALDPDCILNPGKVF
ncbi:MAG TPA: FAD-binding oxidoreductase [Woeseiaceae bacterium]|nr:FAD-binding oxidoreductase [Woeseiaceae bacterium]